METSEKKKCTYEGKGLTHGSEVCIAETCLLCNDGKWEDRINSIYAPPETSVPTVTS